MIRRLAPALALAGAAVGCAAPPPATKAPGAHHLRDARRVMGTRFEIQVVVEDAARGRNAIRSAYDELERIEGLLSEWRETSEISAVNRQAGRRPVRVGPDLLAVVERSSHFAERTGGAFDITFAACGRFWSFRPPRSPSAAELGECLPLVGWTGVEVSRRDSTIFLPQTGMRIGIGAIGKGYGVDRAAGALEACGVAHYVVDGGGDIRLRGRGPDRPWRVGVAHPRRPGELLGWLELAGGAVVTSGDYERFFERDGVRYHHILDPRTGQPARRAIAATVIAPNTTDADALATGLFVIGPEAGLELAERLPDVEALIVGADLREVRTRGFPSLHPPDPPVPPGANGP